MFFSIFNKKSSKTSSPDKNRSGSEDAAKSTPGQSTNSGAASTSSIITLRHIARETERKIDAIEYEMSRDILKKKLDTPPAVIPQQPDANINLFDDDEIAFKVRHQFGHTDLFEATIPLVPGSSDMDIQSEIEAENHVEDMSILEETAILFANGQTEAAENNLKALIQRGENQDFYHSAWLMLFELYQITGNQAQFDELSIDYANQLEISAPAWKTVSSRQLSDYEPGLTPVIAFSGQLDVSIGAQMDAWIAQARFHHRCRLEFAGVTGISLIAIEYLLSVLHLLEKSHSTLTLVGAHDLVKHLLSLIKVGRRDENEAPWLLLLKLLQLLNDKVSFDEVSMDYCITYEVSPPPFERPGQFGQQSSNNDTTEPVFNIDADLLETDRYLFPPVIDSNAHNVLAEINNVTHQGKVLHFDCSQLDRIELSACGQLLDGLISLSRQHNIAIEFHDVNRLVIVLLNALGYANIAVMHPRKS